MNKKIIYLSTLIFFLTAYCVYAQKKVKTQDKNKYGEIKKVKDIVIYKDSTFYSAFPSVIKRPDGDLLVAFRRAPNRKIFKEGGNNHVDPNSYLVSVHSKDGINWSENPKLIYAHPFGGSQDPCLLQLRDGTILCASYGWAFVNEGDVAKMKQPVFESIKGVVFLGGFIVRSLDDGNTWQGPIYPPAVHSNDYFNAYGVPVPSYNRGALYEVKNGNIYWIVAVLEKEDKLKTTNHLLVSKDKGQTWEYSALVAEHPTASFNEASIYETPKGDLVGFLRTAGMDDQACIARSTDGGKSFEWEKMGFQGHPLNALKLPDNRVLLTYGYRHKPYGIRARILNAECTDYETAPEIILRDDGGTTDLGYTWPVQIDDNHILVCYYFNVDNGTRHIAGTLLEIK